MEKPLQKTAQQIQNLINLNAVLGKPAAGTRTICKTPMLYRMTLRGRSEVAEWEKYMSAISEVFDMSGKRKVCTGCKCIQELTGRDIQVS